MVSVCLSVRLSVCLVRSTMFKNITLLGLLGDYENYTFLESLAYRVTSKKMHVATFSYPILAAILDFYCEYTGWAKKPHEDLFALTLPLSIVFHNFWQICTVGNLKQDDA